MENLNSLNRFGGADCLLPWPELRFPCPDTLPPYLLSITKNAGSMHNETLDEYAAAFPNLDTSDEETWRFMITATTRQASQIGLTAAPALSYKAAHEYAINIKLNLNKSVEPLVREGKMSPFIADQTKVILAIVRDYPKPAAMSFQMSGYANRIAYRTDVSVEDKITLLTVSSVAEASGFFWTNALQNEKSSYHKIADGFNSSGSLYKPKWADLIGAVIGAVVGTAAGGPLVGIATGIALGEFSSKVFAKE